MAAIYSNGGNHWNILGFNFTKRDALSSLYKISMTISLIKLSVHTSIVLFFKSKSNYETSALLADKNNRKGMKLTSNSAIFGFTLDASSPSRYIYAAQWL